MFHKIMIANRGEIAVRIIRTCREMGIGTVVVYSDADADALYVKLADEAHHIGPADATQSYLNVERILEVAMRSRVDALHPGYGFLAENPDFVEMCERHGITFIGPPSESMYKVKPKHRARQLMKMLNIPVVPGSDEPLTASTNAGIAHAREIAEEVGYPVIVKPSGGGGGIGMMVANDKNELVEATQYVEAIGKKSLRRAVVLHRKIADGSKARGSPGAGRQVRQCDTSRLQRLLHSAEIPEVD